MTVSLDCMFLVTRAPLPLPRRSPTARVVNVTSAVVWLDSPRMVAFTTSTSGRRAGGAQLWNRGHVLVT